MIDCLSRSRTTRAPTMNRIARSPNSDSSAVRALVGIACAARPRNFCVGARRSAVECEDRVLSPWRRAGRVRGREREAIRAGTEALAAIEHALETDAVS